MRAVTITEGSLSWREQPDPEPADSELLVAVRAAGINAADLLQLRGSYPPPPGYPPDIPGMELAGEVLKVGAKVGGFAPGERVMGIVGGGAQAELALIDQGSAIKVPEGIGWAEAGGFPEVFLTAYDALFSQGRLALGDRLLITGAAGGVGTAAVQLGRLSGAEVIASARRRELSAALLELGAHKVVEPGAAAAEGPFDVVLELVSGPELPNLIGALRVGGRMVVIGTGAGATVEINLTRLMQKRGQILASTLRGRSLFEKAQLTGSVRAHLLPLVEQGRLRVPVAASYPMSEPGAGYERQRAGGKLGKVVLTNPIE